MTARRQEIKTRLDQGMSAREIAHELGITRNGVYKHIHSMRRDGDLPDAFTPTGRRTRMPRNVVVGPVTAADEQSEAELAIRLLLTEIQRTHDELDRIVRRLSAVVPQ